MDGSITKSPTESVSIRIAIRCVFGLRFIAFETINTLQFIQIIIKIITYLIILFAFPQILDKVLGLTNTTASAPFEIDLSINASKVVDPIHRSSVSDVRPGTHRDTHPDSHHKTQQQKSADSLVKHRIGSASADEVASTIDPNNDLDHSPASNYSSISSLSDMSDCQEPTSFSNESKSFDLANPELESSQTNENAILKDPALLDDTIKNSVLEDTVCLDVTNPAKNENFQEGKRLK